MSALHDVLMSVDGLRSDAARRVERQFDSVAGLAGASPEDLEAIKGVGQVMAGRILGAAMATQQRVNERTADPGRIAKGANARTAATADRVIDAAGKVAGGTVGRTSATAREVVEDAEVTARTGVYRLHAKGDETVDKAVEAVEGTKFVAKSVADKAKDSAKQAIKPARQVVDGLLGKDDEADD